MRGWRQPLVLATAIAFVVAGSAASAPQVTAYSRVSATAGFVYKLDYGDNHDDVHNGTYQAFSIACGDSYSHEFERGTHGGGAAHKFDGYVRFDVRFTPFPASELTATKKRLRDRVGKSTPFLEVKSVKDCP